MNNKLYRKCIALAVFILFIGASIAPTISGNILTVSSNDKNLDNFKNERIQSNETKKTSPLNISDNISSNNLVTNDINKIQPQKEKISIYKNNKTKKTNPIRGYNDVFFNSSFEMGNLINIQYQTGDASGRRYYTAEINYSTITFSDKHWWFYFSMENTTGKTITVELQNLAPEDFGIGGGLPRWQSMEPVYSYNDKNWSRVPLANISWNSTALNFSITITPTHDKIWLAPIPPYTVTMRDILFASYADSLYLNVSSLGITPLGQNLTLATITDSTVATEEKHKIYIISQQHSGETVPSFVTEGMIHFLLNEKNPTAEALRKNCIFKIIPIVNVEGVYCGISRYTPFRDGTQYDLNREWHLPVDDMQPEINWTFSDIETWSPDVFMDLHDHSTAKDCFFYKGQDPADSNLTFFMDSIGTYWPETDKSRLTTDKSAGQVYVRLGINPSVIMEHPHDNITSTPEHPVDHNPQTIADWLMWGEGIALGLRDFFGITENVLIVDSEFNESTDSIDLRENAMGRDWYESRNSDPLLLTLNTTNVGRNTGKKAALEGYGSSKTTYLTQDLSAPQNNTFNVSFDIYIDRINNYSNYDRTGFIFLGDDSDEINGPCSTSSERFIYLTFYDSTPDEEGNDLEIKARENYTNQPWNNTSTWTSIATGLQYDTWYTLRLNVDFINSTYDVYVDDILVGENISRYENYTSSYLTDISFSVGGTARGDFYVDNVFAPAVNRHKLNVQIVGGGSVDVNPGESTYANGTRVELNAFADPGWTFVGWSGNLSGSINQTSIVMDDDKSVTATFVCSALLLDSEFNDSINSDDLINNAPGQDWYESRNNDPILLALDTSNCGGNTGKKAIIQGDEITNFAYLTQEFSIPQSDTFNVSLDIYIERISSYFDVDQNRYYNRTGFIFIGDDSQGTNGPCSTSSERFVYLTFYDRTPGDSGDDVELRARENNSQSWYRTHEWTQVATNLSYGMWYTIRLEINVSTSTYDIYVDDVLEGDDISGYSGYASNSVTDISFSGGGTARGNFYVDNVFVPAEDRYTLDVNIAGNGRVLVYPGESTYANGTVVEVNAVADPGWTFDHWDGDLGGSTNPTTINMSSDINITAVFTWDEYHLIINTNGEGSVQVNPEQSYYRYGDVVELNATDDTGWTFTHWTSDLLGSTNPTSIIMTTDMTITAHFSDTAIYTLTIIIDGGGTVTIDPDWAAYPNGEVVELNATGNTGWTFNNWTGDIPLGHENDNPLIITMNNNKVITVHFNSSMPTVQANSVTDITNTSATLWGNLTDTGGENCSVWFEWDRYELGECMGTIATGVFCKDGRSIVHKNRHYYTTNQKPYFYQGVNYSYFGIGTQPGMCRMGQNEKGLAMVNIDIGGTIVNWEYTTDWASGSEDNDFHICLGSFETVKDAAMFLALHGNYGHGHNNVYGQYLLISSEPGVGAIVAIDRVGHTNITWINNTYAGCANAWYCDGRIDHGDYNDVRAKEIMDDIVNNGTSSDGDNLLNWQDIAQRVCKDTSDKEQQDGPYYTGGEISKRASRATTIHVGGNTSLNSSLHMSWLSFGETTQIGIFLPIYAGSLHSSDDIPSNFTEDNDGNGIHPYVNVKRDYARGDLGTGWFYGERVREIQKCAEYNENITFDAFDDLMDTIMYSADEEEAEECLAEFVDDVLPRALHGYIHNLTSWSIDTNKSFTQGIGIFNETITGLKPGTVYYYKAWANNSESQSNGTQMLFLTKPDVPSNVQLSRYNGSQMNITWNKGTGAYFTIIERNKTGVASWGRGEGIEIYNGTGNQFEDTNLSENTRYYYQMWSFTIDTGLHQYSPDYTSKYSDGMPYTGLLVDSTFNDCSDSADLRFNATAQDWYESRNDNPTLLTLNTFDVGGNAGKKAKFTGNVSSNAYLSQEFSQPQTGNFSVHWEIFVDEILDISDPDRSGWMLIGDDSVNTEGDAGKGPCSTNNERFMILAFAKDGGGSTGTMDLVARDNDDIWTSFTTVATGLNLDQWYTIRVDLDLHADTYDVYVDDVYKSTLTSRIIKDSVTHISFATWNDGAGTFYVDNVFAYIESINNAPTISNEYPPNGLTDVSISLSQLSVFVSDLDGDLLNYTIETNPDVGSQDNSSDPGENGGVKTCNISGLTYDTTYTWYVNVTDGKDWNNETFSFETEAAPNNAPLHDSSLLESEFGTNTTDEDLICFNQSTSDPDGDEVYNTYHWFKDGISLSNLSMSFNTRNSTTIKDYSGYGNNGTVHGATWTGDGKVGGTYSFDGMNDYIQIPDDLSLDGNGSWSEMTVEHWIYLANDQTNAATIAKTSTLSEGKRSYQITIDKTITNKLWAAVVLEGNFFRSLNYAIPLNSGVWYHVVLTYKSGVAMRLYINGTEKNNRTDLSGNMQSSYGRDLYIGSRYGTERFFDGMIDEVKIYPFALAEGQIFQNYLQSKDGFSNNATIVSEETSMGDVWQCEVTPSDGQLDGITKVSNTLTIVIFDTTPPEVSNVLATPSSVSQNGYVNITCTVTDNIEVDTVNVSISGPVGFDPVNVSMNKGSYYYNESYTIAGTYYYFIWANDTSGNTNTSTTYIFVIEDTVPPEITSVIATPNSQEAGKYVNISCNVTDNFWVDTVKVNITGPNGFSPKNTTMENKVLRTTKNLADIDSGLISPTGEFRWLDIADQAYSANYRGNYNYTQANVTITYYAIGNTLRGILNATNLKPNFAYQLKLMGTPGTPANERIGLAGRWWQEVWNGSAWTDGWNLNYKGDGYPPSPNDDTYFKRRDTADSSSPTGLKYRYTGYLVFDYFITDEYGNATLNFETNSSYHVLWKTSQRPRTDADGPLKSSTFDANSSSPAYDVDYGEQTISLFGEWERLPVGGVYLHPGDYDFIQMILTEESFHGSGGQYAGNWAAAMRADTPFDNEESYYYNASYDIVGLYDYFIWANDTSGNANTSAVYTFDIWDTTPPEISDVSATPSSTSQGGFVNITCNVTDNIEVDTVNVSISGPTGFTLVNTTMNPGYYYNNTYSISGVYDYFVWVNDTSGNTNISTVHHFEIKELYSVSLNDSWNLVSLPFNESIDKTDIVVSYNEANYSWQDAVDASIIIGFIYSWNEIDQGYEFVDILQPGRGYWMYAYFDCDLIFSNKTINDDKLITNLSVEWNLIGLPYNVSIAKEDLTIYYDETEYTWQQAVDNNTIIGFIYGWDEIDQGYEFVNVLQPGKGYWIYAYSNCTLLYYDS